MIAGCPKCAARYRIDREKLVDGAVRLRCTKCESVFRVRAPEEPLEAPRPADPMGAPNVVAPPPAPQPRPEPPIPQPAVQQAREPAPAPEPPAVEPAARPSGPIVLVAIPDAALAKQTGETLSANDYQSVVVNDGAQAMLEIQRRLPTAVVLAADLPKMFGFQVCEVVKRNESLQRIHVVLVGAIHHPDRYRRPPEEIYGADSYVEAPDLPEGLLPILEGAGIGGGKKAASPAAPVAPAAPEHEFAVGGEPALEIDPPAAPAPEPMAPEPVPVAAPAPPPVVEPAVAPAATPIAPTPSAAAPAPGLGDERAKAERLARIIVSDIILYNEDKFNQAIAAGTVAEALGPDLAEGRGLFEERIDPRVRGDSDYLMAELLRVAKLRGTE